MAKSPKQLFQELSREKQQQFIDSLTDAEADALVNSWHWTARPEQLEPEGDWFCWLVLTGRGWGKTRTASEWIVEQVRSGRAKRIALIGRTAADVRDIQIEGVSGILAVARLRGVQAHYEPSKRRVTFGNGATATAYSAEEPNLLRGPEHDCGWLDELASWSIPRNSENDAYSNFIMGLRLGEPRFIVTTTPRPTRVITQLVADQSTHVTKGSTYDNAANLSPAFLEEVKRRYEQTRLGRQELFGEILDDVEGALWTLALIEDARVSETPPLKRVVIAVDPATTTGDKSDFTGITVAGVGFEKDDYYVLHAEQLKATPNEWGQRVSDLYDEYHADRVIAERNQGGQMVEFTLRTIRKNLPIKTIHASTGKKTRAEPVAALYEQGKVHHVGMHADLEDQMIVFPVVTDVHDDLVDSLVYALTELAELTAKQTGQLITYSRGKGRRR